MQVKVTTENLTEQARAMTLFHRKIFRKIVQKAIAEWMVDVKKTARDEIIPNTSGTRHPKASARIQPSTAGKLTSRTGALRAMLSEGNYSGWKNEQFGLTRVTTDNTKFKSFSGTIHFPVNGDITAWWSGYVQDNSIGVKMIKPYYKKLGINKLKQLLLFRTMHEIGLKGASPRLYLLPAGKKLQDKLPRRILQMLTRYKGFYG